MSRPFHSRGFTLVELMITLALLAIMAFIAIPSFTQLTRNNQLQAKAEELKSFLVFARSEAVTQRRAIKIDALDSTLWKICYASAAPGSDKCPDDANTLRNLEVDSGTAKLVLTNAGGTAIDQLLYRPNGTASVGALITVCRDKDASTGYLTSIAANGSAALFPRGKSDNSGTALAKCE